MSFHNNFYTEYNIIHLGQSLQQHIDHGRLTVLAPGLSLLGQLFGLGLGLGRNGKRLSLTANADLRDDAVGKGSLGVVNTLTNHNINKKYIFIC